MKWHKKLLTIVLLISFIVGLGSFGMKNVSAAAPANPPTPLTPQGEISLCDTLLRNASFKWTAVSGATGYTIQIATVPDFTSILINYSSTNTEVYLGGINLSPGIHYWRVQAYNLDGPSAWSLPLIFYVIPCAPVLVLPPNNNFVLPNVTFVWTTCYSFDTEFQLSNRPDFVTLLIDVNFSASQGRYKGPYVYEYKFYWPLSCGMHWWRVRTKLGTEVSPWTTQPFMIIIPPNIAPTLIAPQDVIISSRSVNIQWSYVANGDRYQLQICKGNSFLTDTVVFATSYNFLGEDNTSYCFRVRAGNPVGWGPWSGWGQFKILLPPNTPTLVSPFNGAVLQNNNIVVLNWNSIPTAASYLVEISNANTSAVQTFEVLAPYTVLNFPGYWGNTYLWKIKAKNPSGESGWSNSWMFTIQENIPPRLEIDQYSQHTNQPTIVVRGKVYDLESGIDALCWGPNPIPTASDGSFEIAFTLQEGPNSFTIFALDKAGNKTVRTIDIFKDTTPPEIDITFPVAPIYPASDVSTVISDIEITGTIKDLLPITLLINNEQVAVTSGYFEYKTKLNNGLNKIYIKAIDAAGNASEKTLLISKVLPETTIKFQINNPKMQVLQINTKGESEWVAKDIDPGRWVIPQIVKGRIFIPARGYIEEIKGEIYWDPLDKKVTIYVKQRGRTIELWIGRNKAQITEADGRQYLVAIENGDGSIVPFIYNGRTYLPLRFISEQLNATVTWDEIQKIATIEFPIVP